MAWRYEGTDDGVDHWDGHTITVEREGCVEEHPDDLWHWSVQHPPTCRLSDHEYLGQRLHECCFDAGDPCFEGTVYRGARCAVEGTADDWPPDLPKTDGLVAALGTRLDVYRHWELGDEVDLWWLVGPTIGLPS
jgi:hypothetical protein